MKVIIKEKEFEYNSDHPQGWKYSAGDDFKFPVEIGPYKCFIKRFEAKIPENISGWNFINAIKAKYEKNLPRIHDIVQSNEKNKDVYYVFYEYIPGTTLDKLSADDLKNVDLKKITQDLFNALNAIQKYDFWYADFCEKNIYVSKDRFYLIDLDSVFSTSQVPSNKLYGNKDYWLTVYDFYKKILGNKTMQLSDLNGKSLNKLQMIFLLLNLKLKQNKVQIDLANLPTLLNNIDPIFKELFQNYLVKNEDDESLIKIIYEKIITRNVEKQESDKNEVLINNFEINKTEAVSEESFVLKWEIEFANKIELLKNGKFYKEIGFTEKELEIQEKSFDGKTKTFKYQLQVKNDVSETKSKILSIDILPKTQNELKILNFTCSEDSVKANETLIISWETENASKIQLLQNDNVIHESDLSVGQYLTLANDIDEAIEFHLIASNDFIQVGSEKLKVNIIKEENSQINDTERTKKNDEVQKLNVYSTAKDGFVNKKNNVKYLWGLVVLLAGIFVYFLYTKVIIATSQSTVSDNKQIVGEIVEDTMDTTIKVDSVARDSTQSKEIISTKKTTNKPRKSLKNDVKVIKKIETKTAQLPLESKEVEKKIDEGYKSLKEESVKNDSAVSNNVKKKEKGIFWKLLHLKKKEK